MLLLILHLLLWGCKATIQPTTISISQICSWALNKRKVLIDPWCMCRGSCLWKSKRNNFFFIIFIDPMRVKALVRLVNNLWITSNYLWGSLTLGFYLLEIIYIVKFSKAFIFHYGVARRSLYFRCFEMTEIRKSHLILHWKTNILFLWFSWDWWRRTPKWPAWYLAKRILCLRVWKYRAEFFFC